MVIGFGRGHAATGRTLQKTALDQVRFIYFLNGPDFFGTGRGQGFHAHRGRRRNAAR